MQQKLIVQIEVESEYMFTSYDVELALRAYSPTNKFFVKEAAQQGVQRTASPSETILGLCSCDRCKQMRGEL